MSGRFVRTYWYEPGIEHGNPTLTTRFRVNAPETSLDPAVMYRSEARGNGMLQILIDEDLARINDPVLQLELWGGHPGTANKRVTVNGRTRYAIPETGTAAGHCTHGSPIIPLQRSDLVNGYNALQFACDRGTADWGHFIIDNAAFHLGLVDDHPDLGRYGLRHFDALIQIDPVPEQEAHRLRLVAADEAAISHVFFMGRYRGYDESGSGEERGWHGFRKDREPVAVLGHIDRPPFEMVWDTSMLPAQQGMDVQATLHFAEHPEMSYATLLSRGLDTLPRRARVRLFLPTDVPVPFWSRAGQPKRCTLPLHVSPAAIERAELHVVIWDGGRGTVAEPFTLNGHPLPVAGDGAHDTRYCVVPVDPAWLRQGDNEIVVLSDTEHHGIEVLRPGPAMMVRWHE